MSGIHDPTANVINMSDFVASQQLCTIAQRLTCFVIRDFGLNLICTEVPLDRFLRSDTDMCIVERAIYYCFSIREFGRY